MLASRYVPDEPMQGGRGCDSGVELGVDDSSVALGRSQLLVERKVSPRVGELRQRQERPGTVVPHDTVPRLLLRQPLSDDL